MSYSQINSNWSPPSRDQLLTLSGEDCSQWKIALGDIYLQTAAGKLIRLKRAGDCLEESWRNRFKDSVQLLYRPVMQIEKITELKNIFQKWNEADDPVDVETYRESFVSGVRQSLRPEGAMKIIEWCFLCHDLFKPQENLIEEFQNKHVVLYRRGMMVSSMAVLLAIGCGYQDPVFLRDIYHTGWWLDAGLIHEDFSYWVALACQAERNRPGAGDQLLEENATSEKEKELFLQHPRYSFNRAQETVAGEFTYPDLLMSILRHHEKSDGTGFPEAMTLSVLSDWETLVMLADNLVDYREEVLEAHYQSGLGLLWAEFKHRPISGLPVERVVRQLKAWFARPKEEAMSA